MSNKQGRTEERHIYISFVTYFISKNIFIKCSTYDKVRREAKIFPTPCLNSSTRATQNHKKIYNLLKVI